MKLGIIFPGYGSQFVTMAKELYDESRLIQEYFEEASNCLNTNFVKLCFASSECELAKIQNAYPALFLVSSAIIALLKERGLTAEIVAGYGVGEYGALHAAGSLSLPDGLYLLSKLAHILSEELSGRNYLALRITGMSDRTLARLCRSFSEDEENQIYRSIFYSSQESVIVGIADNITEFKQFLSNTTSAHVREYPIEFGLYSHLAQPVVASLSMYLEKVDFKDCDFSWVRSSDAQLIKSGRMIRNSIIKHLTQPLRFDKVLQKFNDIDCIIVPAPGAKLAQSIQQLYPDKRVVALLQPSDIENLVKDFGHVNINSPENIVTIETLKEDISQLS